jgi:hypothetical protein
MRRFLLSVTFVTLSVAILGVLATWPKVAENPARTAPTLAEFQRGIRMTPPSTAARPASPVPATQVEPPRRVVMLVTASSPRAVADADQQRMASTRPLPQVLEFGENVPAVGAPRSPVPHPAPEAARPDGAPPEAAQVSNARSTSNTPPPAARTAIASASEEIVLSIASIARAVETEEPPAVIADDPVANTPPPTSVIARHAEQIAIHYHNDSRSSADAKRISSRLGSAGANRIEMRTTAHIVPASSVRYFARQDASAAASLARMLGSSATEWRVDDCTAYRHRPARGTIEVWPATVGPLAAR